MNYEENTEEEMVARLQDKLKKLKIELSAERKKNVINYERIDRLEIEIEMLEISIANI